MPTITFSDNKHAFLTFQAEAIETDRDGVSMLLTAGGEITQQDTQALEERIAFPTECHVCIEDGGKELISQRLSVTFVAVEPGQLVARLGA